MTLYEELTWRGVANQITHAELTDLLEKEPFTFYCGFDPTASSLTVGGLLPAITIARFQRRGHKPIVLIGGGTGMIGDPSFKSDERPLLSAEQVAANMEGLQAQLRRFVDFDGPNAATMVNNADWLGKMGLLDFLRDIGKHFSVNVLLSRDSVRQRLEDRDHGISYTEFTYCLLQAYDFLHLYDAFHCRLQIGGSDQWGNIVSGMDLTRRIRTGASTFGLTLPLVTKADGTKFGKSETGNIWLDPERTSPYKFYQFWINQPDDSVVRFLKYFTFLDKPEIDEQERLLREAPETRAAQKKLAEEVTLLVHGEDGLAKAQKATQAMFSGNFAGLDEATLGDIFSDVPSSDLPATMLETGRLLVDALVEGGVFASKSEVRRMIQSGGLYLNSERVAKEDAQLSKDSVCTGRIAVIRKGKKNYHLLRFVN